MRRLHWALNRLRAMGGREIAYRLRHAVQARWERHGLGLARPGVPIGANGRGWSAELACDFHVSAYREAAEKVLAGRFNVFAMRDAVLGCPPEWNRDPKTGTVAPLLYGKMLNYRDERIVGDIKYLWEPNRHLELVTLAQAWHLTNDLRFAHGCRILLDSWFELCPYPLGVNWTSSLEHAVRLLNWSFAWHLLGGDKSVLFDGNQGAAFRLRWLTSIYQHCHFIAGHFSRYSSANNHLLGEYMGLLVGTITWPMWPECKQWQTVAKEGFEAQALLQNSADGVNREQAVYYQHEVIDMMLLIGLIGRANGIEFGTEYWNRLESLLEFIAAVMDCNGNVPMIGDSDDALMVRLSQEASWSPYRSLLASGAVIFKRGDFAAKAQHFDDKSRWLLGDAAALQFASLPKPMSAAPRTAFPEGGYYLLGARFGQPDEVRAVVDCAPLGYLSIAAHGHADALAMVLSAGGQPLLIDPGTYAYHTQKVWRDYFRGTFAHNTVRVDGLDQSVIGGNFLWLNKANSTCESFDVQGDRQAFQGQHDGYMRLADPVRHQRVIVFDSALNQFTVVDTLDCTGAHTIEICWHFSDSCTVTRNGEDVTAATSSVSLTMAMPAGELTPTMLRGQVNPPAGWISKSFDVKEPTTTVVWRGAVTGTTSFKTVISLFFD